MRSAGPASCVGPTGANILRFKRRLQVTPGRISVHGTPRHLNGQRAETQCPHLSSTGDGVGNQALISRQTGPRPSSAQTDPRLESSLPSRNAIHGAKDTSALRVELPIAPLRRGLAPGREHDTISRTQNTHLEPSRPPAVGLVPDSCLDRLPNADATLGFVHKDIRSSGPHCSQNEQRRESHDDQARSDSPGAGLGWANAHLRSGHAFLSVDR